MRVGRPWISRTSLIVADGNLDMNGYGILFNDVLLKRVATESLGARDSNDTGYREIYARWIRPEAGVYMLSNGAAIRTPNVDNNFTAFQARDSGVGLVEIARLQGAADPYFQFTLPPRLNPSAEPGTPVEGHFLYDSGQDILKYRDNSAFRSVMAEFTLDETATTLVLGRATTERSTTNTTATKVKEIKVMASGGLYTRFDLRSGGGATVYGQIDRNGSSVGTLRSTTSTTDISFTETITGWTAGDLLQLYIYASAGETVYTNDLYLYGRILPTVVITD